MGIDIRRGHRDEAPRFDRPADTRLEELSGGIAATSLFDISKRDNGHGFVAD